MRRCTNGLFSLAFALIIWAQPRQSRELILEIEQINQTLAGSESTSLIDVVRRSKLLAEVIRQDPQRALTLALPAHHLARIRSEDGRFSTFLESPGVFDGELEVLISDDFARGTAAKMTYLRTGSEVLEASFVGLPPDLSCGAKITATGIRIGNLIAARIESATPNVGLVCSAIGEQKTAVLLVNFANSQLPSQITPAFIRNVYFGPLNSLDAYWKEVSYGKTWATGDVFGPFTLSTNDYPCNQLDAMRNDAIAAADATVDFTKYTRIVVIYPTSSLCGGGLGTIGCNTLTSADGTFSASTSWLRADFFDSGLGLCGAAHEGGHNLGLHHASSLAFAQKPLGAFGDLGTHAEYGDRFSIMGACDGIHNGHYSAQHKSLLNWLAPENYATVETSGTYTLAPVSSTSSTLQTLKIRRGIENDAWLWVEFRQPVGFDASLSSFGSQVYSGAIIHYDDPAQSDYQAYSRLLDFTPVSSPGDFTDAPLASGSSWSDPYSLLKLTVNSASANGLNLSVTYEIPCASLSPMTVASAAGGSTGTITVTGPGTCGWTALSDSSWVTITSGQGGAGSGIVTYKVDANPTTSERKGKVTIARQSVTITQAGQNNVPPVVNSVSPSTGIGYGTTFTLLFSDANGSVDIKDLQINIHGSSTQLCFVYMRPSQNSIWLLQDSGLAYSGPIEFGSSQTLENSQCTLNGLGTTFSSLGNNLTVTLALTFKPDYAGWKTIEANVRDQLSTSSGFTKLGTWGVPGSSCIYALGTTSQSFQASFGNGTISVTNTVPVIGGCSWTATSNSAWLTITGGSPGSGDGTVSYSVAINPSSLQRTGTITVAGLTFTVTQAGAACTYDLSPPSATANATGGSSSFGVVAPEGCAWSANSNSAWITLSPGSGATGSGNGTVTYVVGQNPAGPRTGTVSAAGKTFTVNQSGYAVPAPSDLTPRSGSGVSSTFVFTFSSTSGFSSLTVVNVLINNAIDGRNACYLAFVPSSGTSGSLFLVDDAGNAGGPYTGLTLPGTGSASNSQCTISGQGSTVNGAGNLLTLSLTITFKSAFAGNKVVYMAAQNNSPANSGWKPLGTWNVPGAPLSGPGVIGMSPAYATTSPQTLTFAYSHSSGYSNITVANVLLNGAINGISACYIAFVPSGATGGAVFLIDDAGNAGGPYQGMTLPGSGTVANSQCAIDAIGSSVSSSGNNLTLTLKVTFKPSFAGYRIAYLAARSASQNSNWQAVGLLNLP